MPAPAVTATTEAVYEQLPEHLRSADETLQWPLLRYLALFGDQADEVDQLSRLLDAGILADPAQVDSSWLDWLAQFVALPTAGLTVPEKRLGISSASALQAGSAKVLRQTVEALLGGQKRYIIEYESGGNPWAVTIYANVDDAGGATWDTLALDYPSWDAWEASGTWDNLFVVAPLADRANLAAVIPAWLLVQVELLADGHVWLFLERAITSWTQWESHFTSWNQLETEVFPWQ